MSKPTTVSPPHPSETSRPAPPAATCFYNFPKTQVKKWVAANPSDSRMPAIKKRLAKHPASLWVGGGWTSNGQRVSTAVTQAKAAGKTPVLTIYNIPNRDNGGNSSGGAKSEAAYRSWIEDVAAQIGDNPVWCIVEPDALAFYGDGADMSTSCIRYAVQKLKANPNARVYIDAGTATWPGNVDRLVQGLHASGIEEADGFSLNVSNFVTTARSARRGDQLSSRVHGKPYVIDTSRNGNGSNGQWCNPPGRQVGVVPTTATKYAKCDAYLWVKLAGESDGLCNGGPPAGRFSAALAYDLVR